MKVQRQPTTPTQRLERFVALQRRAARILAASPDGYRRFWERNLRQRRIHASPTAFADL
jgi:hypothetical protein